MQRVGLVQMTSGPEISRNLTYLKQEVAKLAQQGAQWIVTPENALLLGNREQYHQQAESLDHGPVQHALASLAKEYGVWLLIGSMPIRRADGVTTSSLLWNAQGERVAVYDKLHMFDVDVADGHQRYRESETFTPGQQVSSPRRRLERWAYRFATMCAFRTCMQNYGAKVHRFCWFLRPLLR